MHEIVAFFTIETLKTAILRTPATLTKFAFLANRFKFITLSPISQGT